jgi:type VI secretion system protein ImpJ
MTVEVEARRRSRRRERRIAGASELPAAVHWHEGMLLAPQHFQLASQRSEALPYYHTAAVSPFHWGLMELERAPFGEGVVTVVRVEAVMPDGLVVTYPGGGASAENGEADLTLDLTKYVKDVKEGKQTVYLAVASHQPGERFAQRYDTAASEKVPDDNTGKDDLELQVLRPRLQLVLADELPSSYSGFPLTRVAWMNGALIETPYEPPWLRIRAGSNIHSACSAVATRLRESATALARRVEGESESARGPQLLATRMMIHGFVANLPAFEALLESGVAHPFPLYLAFASMLGNISLGVVPPRLDVYDHDDLLPCFEKVKISIETVLRNAVKERYATHPFRLEGDEFSLRIDIAWLASELVIGIRTPSGRTQEEVHDWVMGSAMGARSRIDSLRKRRITGLSRQRLREHELIPTAGVVFYAIEKPYGDLLLPAEDLVIANPGEGQERRPEEIVLYVKSKD